ncbi:MAG: hypothetical protein ACI9ND_002975 [Yoonia sp.]
MAHFFEKIKVGFTSNVGDTAIDTEYLKSVCEANFEKNACDLLAANLRELLDQTYEHLEKIGLPLAL